MMMVMVMVKVIMIMMIFSDKVRHLVHLETQPARVVFDEL